MMKAKALRELTVDFLQKEIFQVGREQFNLKTQHATRQLTTTHRLKVVRRNLARLLTVLHEKAGKKT